MTKRPTIGRDPLDALLTPTVPAPKETRETPAPRKPATASRKPEKATVPPARSRAVRVTYALPEDLVAETRNAVVALSGPPVRLTLSGLVEAALRRELERLRKTHNGGKPFSGSGAALRGGRPLK